MLAVSAPNFGGRGVSFESKHFRNTYVLINRFKLPSFLEVLCKV